MHKTVSNHTISTTNQETFQFDINEKILNRLLTGKESTTEAGRLDITSLILSSTFCLNLSSYSYTISDLFRVVPQNACMLCNWLQ